MKKKYPIGVDDYKEIIDENLYFVDKTLMIKDIIDDGSKVLLFTRPRRFGKTLNMSMIFYYFNKSKINMSNLFEGKKICACGSEYNNHQGRYPVIYVTLKDWKPVDWENGFMRIRSDIARLFIKFDYLMKSEKIADAEKEVFKDICTKKSSKDECESSLKFLSELLEKHHDEKVMILIDEYDTLLNEAYSRDFYDDAIAFLRNFLGSALKNNLSLHKGLLTGIFKVAKESIFSDMNNLKPCSIINDEYAQYFGFTEDEVQEALNYYEISEECGNVAKWYNGYIFGKTEFVTIYNPWSIMMYLNEKVLQPYWVNTSGNVIIKEIAINSGKDVQYEIEDLLKGKVLHNKPINQFMVYEEIKANGSNIWSFLLMSGYLKPVKIISTEYNLTYCDIAVPNTEVLSFYKGMYKSWLDDTMPRGSVDALLKALVTGDVESFYEMFEDIVMRTVSYNDVGKDTSESFYHAFTLGLLVNLNKNYAVVSNRESGFGRYDVMIIPKDKTKLGIIIEFKKVNVKRNETLDQAAVAAMNQIEDKKYETELKSQGVTNILKLGIAFKGKEILIRNS